MRPVSIRFKGFGPYVGEQYIDVTQFEKNGLFLICGETGAGKTTILDAICMALFGRSSGSKPGDLDKMRCKLCAKEDETLVEFIFDSDGRRYKFMRRGIFKTKNFNEDHKCYELKDGIEVLISEKKSQVNQKAEELMGLTCDQFRQVVILPQGEFEKLLTSKSEEKEAILTSLFHAERWSAIAERVTERVTVRTRALNQEKVRIESKLTEYGCTDPEALLLKLREDREVLEQCGQQLEEVTLSLQKSREAYEGALLEDRDFRELEQRRLQLEKLLAKEEPAAREERLLRQAEEAQKLIPLHTAWQESRKGLTAAEKAQSDAEKRRDQARKDAKAAEAARLALDGRREACDRDREKKTLLENAGELYGTLGQKQRALLSLARERSAAEEQYGLRSDAFDQARQKWEAESARYDALVEEYRLIQERYRRGIRSILAADLQEGAPCPVCGSTVHPAPATTTGEHISDADVDRSHKAMESQMAKVRKARQAREQAEQAREEARALLEQTAHRHAALKAEVDAMLERKIPGVETAEQLERAISEVKNRIWAFEEQDRRTAEALMNTATALSVAEAALVKAGEGLEEARILWQQRSREWEEALEASGFDSAESFLKACVSPEDLKRRTEILIRFHSALESARTALEEQTALLAGREKPRVELLKAECERLQKEHKLLTEQVSVRRSRLEKMEQDALDLQKRKAAYDEKRTKLDADQEFADRLRGVRGVSLRRYVLGVMLTSITVSANQLLKNVHGGRYQLFRTDERTGRTQKAGLELEVYDAQNNERRSVTTLSGGEKFLVALSLAIGLSAVVQAQGHGMRLEAMFIDEGFGSLDRESIADALEVLQGIRRSHGIVGIISHVDQLAETIPTKIRIQKSEKGSSCKVCL